MINIADQAVLSIIIPVYNEADNIERNLNAIKKGAEGLSDTFSIYIIYDFDEDNTLPIISKIRNKYTFNIFLIKNEAKGVCNAIKTGFSQAKGTYLLVTMADMSDDYDILPPMLRTAQEGFDIVCGSRYMKGGKTYGGSILKKNLSRWAGISLHFLTKVPTHDITNSYKLYKKSLLSKISIESEGGFEIGMEITAKAFLKGYKITEIPSQWWDRTAGQSKFKFFLWLPKYIRWYCYLLVNNIKF